MAIQNHLIALVVLYTAAMFLGLMARYRRRSYGRWHHVLFGLTCTAFLWNFFRHPTAAHIPLAVVLVMLPLTRPRVSRRHDVLALTGAVFLIILAAVQ